MVLGLDRRPVVGAVDLTGRSGLVAGEVGVVVDGGGECVVDEVDVGGAEEVDPVVGAGEVDEGTVAVGDAAVVVVGHGVVSVGVGWLVGDDAGVVGEGTAAGHVQAPDTDTAYTSVLPSLRVCFPAPVDSSMWELALSGLMRFQPEPVPPLPSTGWQTGAFECPWLPPANAARVGAMVSAAVKATVATTRRVMMRSWSRSPRPSWERRGRGL